MFLLQDLVLVDLVFLSLFLLLLLEWVLSIVSEVEVLFQELLEQLCVLQKNSKKGDTNGMYCKKAWQVCHRLL